MAEYEKVWVYDRSLKEIEAFLRQNGFVDTMLQTWKQGQVFGLVKKLNFPWEMHVRGFKDEHLEAEIEVSRDYLEHLDDRYRRSAGAELSQILSTCKIPHTVERDSSSIKLDLETPSSVTPWKPIVGLGAIVLAVYILTKSEY